MSAWDYYDQAEDQLKAFTRSAVRTKIMLRLKEGGMTAGVLEKEMNIRASTILHAMKEMSEAGLVSKRDISYSLTNIGTIQTILLDELVAAIVLLEQHEDYWLSHDLSGIPEELLAKIGMLARSQRMTSDPTAPLKSLERFMSEVAIARDIRGVSSFIAPGFPELIRDCVKGGAKVELVLTDAVFEEISNKNKQLLEDIQNLDNFHLYHLDKEVNIGFTVTESILALGLWRLDGSIDIGGGELVCIGEEATKWGRALFEHYRSLSQSVRK
ncbi:MAG: winged helix-turn-helix domain-containing protein [Methanotrichaceae archaeon]|jgi:predicted transcriptional regulator